MAKHPFLSDEWFAIVEQLVEQHGAQAPAQIEMVTNIVVTGTPFGLERHLNMSSRAGQGHVGIGHVPDADATVTTDYETAKDMFVSGDPSAALSAFMAGKVRIQGAAVDIGPGRGMDDDLGPVPVQARPDPFGGIEIERVAPPDDRSGGAREGRVGQGIDECAAKPSAGPGHGDAHQSVKAGAAAGAAAAGETGAAWPVASR